MLHWPPLSRARAPRLYFFFFFKIFIVNITYLYMVFQFIVLVDVSIVMKHSDVGDIDDGDKAHV